MFASLTPTSPSSEESLKGTLTKELPLSIAEIFATPAEALSEEQISAMVDYYTARRAEWQKEEQAAKVDGRRASSTGKGGGGKKRLSLKGEALLDTPLDL